MKKLFFLSFFSSLFYNSYAQTIDFQTTLVDINVDEYVTEATEYKDGNFIIAGNKNISNNPSANTYRYGDSGFLLKLDIQGQITQRVDFPNNRILSIETANENEIIICGTNGQKSWIASIDSSLHINWEFTKINFNSNSTYELFSSILIQDNSIIAVGEYVTSNGLVIYVAKLSEDGNFIFGKSIYSPLGFDAIHSDLIVDISDQSCFWISGSNLSNSPSYGIDKAIKLDGNLTTVDSVKFISTLKIKTLKFYDYEKFILGGFKTNLPDTISPPFSANTLSWVDLAFRKVDKDSTNIFQANITTEHGKVDTTDFTTQTTCLDFTQKDLIYLGGNSNMYRNFDPYLEQGGFNQDDSWFFINCLDSTGVLQWQRYIGGDENYYLMSILATRDGGVLLLGTTFDYNSGVNRRNVHIVKLKNDIQVNSENIKIENDFSVQVFPNPATDYIQFSIVTKQAKSQNYQLKIYNLSGQLMMEKQLRTGLSTYSVSSLAKGQYFYMITDENNRLMKSDKFVKVK